MTINFTDDELQNLSQMIDKLRFDSYHQLKGIDWETMSLMDDLPLPPVNNEKGDYLPEDAGN